MISAVIPTLRGVSRLERNLGSVTASLEASAEGWEVVVVDDGGGGIGDLGAGVRVVRLERNRGYGPAVNVGVAEARGEYLLVLNDDVHLGRDCVRRLRSHFPDPSLFAVVPAIRSPLAECGDEGGKVGIWQAGLIEIQELAARGLHPTLYAVGCCYLCSRETYQGLGGYDDLYAPFFWEDTDLGYRAWRRGLRILHDPEVECAHEGSATLREHRTFEEREWAFHRNRILYHLRNLQNAGLRAQCLGACAALALFEPSEPRRRGLLDAFQAFAAAGRTDADGLSDGEILERVRGR